MSLIVGLPFPVIQPNQGTLTWAGVLRPGLTVAPIRAVRVHAVC